MSQHINGHLSPGFSDEDYIKWDPFQGEEAQLECRRVAIVKARKQHSCFSLDGKQDHFIEPGQRYRYETALVDGSFWGKYRICLGCMDKWLTEILGTDEDDE